jgi:hypothetical protein
VRADRIGLALALPALVACGGGSTPAVPTAAAAPSHAAVRLVVAPDPIPSSADGAAGAALREAAWTLTITETAGVGGTLNFVNGTLRDMQTGAVADPGGRMSLGAADLVTLAGGTRLPPQGTVTIPGRLVYGLPYGSAGGRLTITVQMTDDAGALVTGSTSAPVD